MAGQATRRGVTCSRDSSPDAVERYYDLLERAARQRGAARPHIPKALLDALARWGGADVEIWFAKHNEELIAGGVVAYGSDELFFWSAAMRREFGTLRPSNALNMALLHAAADRGVRWYNLGASEGLTGVARFKRDLGARAITYFDFEFKARRYAFYSHLRKALAPSRSA
jgi:lipid II:glycine glycyltransferase (peptidoglycan interpeptide bridge formation enzyme)